MPTDKQKEYLEAYKKYGSYRKAAKMLGVSRTTVSRACQRSGVLEDYAPDVSSPTPAKKTPVDLDALKMRRQQDEISRLRKQLKNKLREGVTAANIREQAFNLSRTPLRPAPWAAKKRMVKGSVGTPVLFFSDLHWGEVVKPEQVFRKNSFDLQIARKRLFRVTERAIDILQHHIVCPKGYPGLILALGGDMISGAIHEELLFTDELPPAACVVDLCEHLITSITTLVDAFGKIQIACVTGNHGRSTHRPWTKMRVESSYDWMLYCMLEQWFRKDDRVSFLISEETDVYFEVEGTRFLLTHGDSMGVKGGDGIIGALGPIMRGRHKVAANARAIGRSFDVLMMGHWHQYMNLGNVVVNGSLKGFDEYARTQRFSFERPRQALFIVHPEHGVTFSVPVYADNVDKNTGEPLLE